MANEQNLKPFAKGDARINRAGRPRIFTALRLLAQSIGDEIAKRDGKPLLHDGHPISVTEWILRGWANSKDFRAQALFLEIAYGKPPRTVEVSSDAGMRLVLDWGDYSGESRPAGGWGLKAGAAHDTICTCIVVRHARRRFRTCHGSAARARRRFPLPAMGYHLVKIWTFWLKN